MTNRPPATYRDSTITSQPKPPNKNKSRKTVSLTPAETRVLTLLTTYQTLAGIGSQLGIARPTVKTHVQNIYKKLGATKRAEAVKLAESAGLLPDRAALTSRKDSGMALIQQRALRTIGESLAGRSKSSGRATSSTAHRLRRVGSRDELARAC